MKRLLPMCLALLAATTATADLLNDVRCREIGFSQSAERQDLAAFRSFIDADARFVAASVSRGVDNIAQAWSAFFTDGGPGIKWRPEIVEVLEDGKLALSRGPYRVLARDTDGKLVESWGTFNSIWRLHDDGEWRVVFDAGSRATSEPDDTTKALLDAEDDCP